jgi:alkanesulfonate monooxygenase SsuD/methylene tetrahydromethanopterin reductase-like flavin-dependent oxidoreductase (luciferase family)
VRERDSGTFFAPEKFRRLDHKGRFFQVEGPLNIQRSPQGQPVIFQAGSSDDGIALAGKCADAVFTHSPSLEETRAFTQKVKNSAIAHGRSGNDVKIFPGIGPIVGRTAEEAKPSTRQSPHWPRWRMRWPIWAASSTTTISASTIRTRRSRNWARSAAIRSVPPPTASSRMRARRA